MQLAVERPHLRAHCRDGSVWIIAWLARDHFEAEWVAGKAFWRGLDAWGGLVHVKLADVVGLSVWDEERIALRSDEDAEEKRRKMLDGEA